MKLFEKRTVPIKNPQGYLSLDKDDKLLFQKYNNENKPISFEKPVELRDMEFKSNLYDQDDIDDLIDEELSYQKYEEFEHLYKEPRNDEEGLVNENTKDLFEFYNELPEEVTEILSFYELEELDYITCEKLLKELETAGYSFDFISDLQINHNESITKISGNLEVLSANIAPTDFSNTVTLTSDIIYTNNKGEPLYKKSSPLQLFIDVFVTIKKITLDYKGVNAAITGETKLTQTPTTELSAYGQLQFLYGSYKAYGQALTIQKGSTLNFIHDLDNPQLNITASKHIPVSAAYMTLPSYQPYLIAGVEVTGTADEPIIRLFTIPGDVSQQDILSYLIFGFPQSQLSRSQASALYSAFNMMDISNGNFSLTALQKNIQQEFGFSEFGIGNTSEYNSSTQQYETGTAFVVGKRITDNLTATYNVGILVPVNVFYLRYQLAQHWALQSDSSALGNGGDIFYTISRD